MRYFVLFLFSLTLWAKPALATVSSLVADTSSGLIIESKNASVQQYPASLTKVMTLYLTFNALDNGLLKMDDKLPVSKHAERQPRSKMFLKQGSTITVRDAILALIIKSANDAAVVLAEALAPSEADFAKMMTEVAGKLGLKNTQFRNASGLHHPEQVTTAQDMALLTIAMINHFPHYYKLFSRKNFWYQGKEYKTHNHVTKKYAGAEGLKTGYIAAVGYNIISTAKRKNDRLVSVVIGQSSGAVRDKQVMSLLDKGFTVSQKQKSSLKKMVQSGKYGTLNKQAAAKKPNMSKYLSIMKQRLAQTKKPASNTKTQLAEAQKQTEVALAKKPPLPPLKPILNTNEASQSSEPILLAQSTSSETAVALEGDSATLQEANAAPADESNSKKDEATTLVAQNQNPQQTESANAQQKMPETKVAATEPTPLQEAQTAAKEDTPKQEQKTEQPLLAKAEAKEPPIEEKQAVAQAEKEAIQAAKESQEPVKEVLVASKKEPDLAKEQIIATETPDKTIVAQAEDKAVQAQPQAKDTAPLTALNTSGSTPDKAVVAQAEDKAAQAQPQVKDVTTLAAQNELNTATQNESTEQKALAQNEKPSAEKAESVLAQAEPAHPAPAITDAQEKQAIAAATSNKGRAKALQEEPLKIAQSDSNEPQAVAAKEALSKLNAAAEKATPEKEIKVAQKPRGKWGVQVGAFSQKEAAQTQAQKALKLSGSKEAVVKVMQNDKVYRSRLYGFQNRSEANKVCRKLESKNIQCLPVL